MNASEHRALGDAATGAALVNVGGDSADDQFLLTFGDVVALSGDFFGPDQLFTLARTAGHQGTRLHTRDEIVGALKVATVDEDVVDRRFEPGGRFAGFRFSPGAERTDVERSVRDRYLTLAANNDDHFVAPGHSDATTGSGFGSARSAYRNLHQVALDHAARLGAMGEDFSPALAREAAAQHFLTDAFAAGHLRTPVADIRRYWKGRYPDFWEHLQRRVASDTARALRELSWFLRHLPAPLLAERTLSEVRARTSTYPELSVGDLVARCFHDWDNVHGVELEGGGVLYGDGHVGEGVTRDLALAAVQAGIDDVAFAYAMGASGHTALGRALYAAVREATGAGGDAFAAEMRIPRPSAGTPCQNWLAPDAETLWRSPLVGSGGPTVGQALEAMLEPDQQFMRQVDGLGQGLGGGKGPFAIPLVGAWLRGRCCQAYHDGFVAPLARDPRPVLLSLVADDREPAPASPAPAASRV